MDGRRVPTPTTTNSNFNQPSTLGIPLASVERIEVLPASAGAIYGGGATGGVVNIVLKHNYEAVDLALTYENTFDTDVARKKVDVSGGFSFNHGKSRVSFSASLLRGNSLRSNDRDFVSKARELVLKNTPATVFGTTVPYGATPNIARARQLSATSGTVDLSAPLTLKNGTVLSGAVTFVPYGYSGPGSDGGAALIQNSGRYNLKLGEILGDSVYGPRRDSFSFGVEHEPWKNLRLYTQASGWRDEQTTYLPSDTTIFFPAGDTNNPFLDPVIVNVPVPDNALRSSSKGDALSVLGGALVRLPHEWQLGLEGAWEKTAYLIR